MYAYCIYALTWLCGQGTMRYTVPRCNQEENKQLNSVSQHTMTMRKLILVISKRYSVGLWWLMPKLLHKLGSTLQDNIWSFHKYSQQCSKERYQYQLPLDYIVILLMNNCKIIGITNICVCSPQPFDLLVTSIDTFDSYDNGTILVIPVFQLVDDVHIPSLRVYFILCTLAVTSHKESILW